MSERRDRGWKIERAKRRACSKLASKLATKTKGPFVERSVRYKTSCHNNYLFHPGPSHYYSYCDSKPHPHSDFPYRCMNLVLNIDDLQSQTSKFVRPLNVVFTCSASSCLVQRSDRFHVQLLANDRPVGVLITYLQGTKKWKCFWRCLLFNLLSCYALFAFLRSITAETPVLFSVNET